MALYTPLLFILLILGIDTAPIHFRKQMIAAESFESVGVFDVNNDQNLDLVSGAFWYEGPHFLKRHIVAQPRRFGEYYDDFSTVPMDVDGDGWIDFITGGWNDNSIYWRKNPGNFEAEWKEQKIGETGNIETTRAWDIDGDGVLEIVPNNPGKPLRVFKLIVDATGRGTGKFQAYQVWDKQGHGLGFGDLNNDGRGDLIINNGWLEAPKNPFVDKWIFHQEFDLQSASIPIIITDVNGDGKNDCIAGKGHDYGLNWYEQKTDPTGKRSGSFIRSIPLIPNTTPWLGLIWITMGKKN
nr:VCBS repeat-containing protein [Haliscomenobacter sp.]